MAARSAGSLLASDGSQTSMGGVRMETQSPPNGSSASEAESAARKCDSKWAAASAAGSEVLVTSPDVDLDEGEFSLKV